jgi:5-methyltetrahydrofolate--homocysteine methyltransferase
LDILEQVKVEVIWFDGAMGSLLQAKGLTSGECPEEWNVTHPEIVAGVHQAYVEAGSQVVETNSFGGTRLKLDKFGRGDKVVQFNRAAAEIAKEAVGSGALVGGSVGPTGEFLEPLGPLSESTMTDAFREQIEALIQGGADLICVETMADLNEATLAVRAAKAAADLPIAAAMSFNLDRNGFRTVMGVRPDQAVYTLLEAGADIVGANCGGIEIRHMVDLIQQMRRVTSAPLLGYPNAGVPELVNGRAVFTQRPEDMAGYVVALRDGGAQLIGGCCGTTPAHIRAMINALQG